MGGLWQTTPLGSIAAGKRSPIIEFTIREMAVFSEAFAAQFGKSSERSALPASYPRQRYFAEEFAIPSLSAPIGTSEVLAHC